MKNRVLLHRSGRDQYGNPGCADLPQYLPSPEGAKHDNAMWQQHSNLNVKFVETYGDRWLSIFDGMTKKEIWRTLFPHGRPALNTFYSHIRQHDSLQDYLHYRLVRDKRKSLRLLDFKEKEIKEILYPFKECGRYFVAYGNGEKFSTNI